MKTSHVLDLARKFYLQRATLGNTNFALVAKGCFDTAEAFYASIPSEYAEALVAPAPKATREPKAPAAPKEPRKAAVNEVLRAQIVGIIKDAKQPQRTGEVARRMELVDKTVPYQTIAMELTRMLKDGVLANVSTNKRCEYVVSVKSEPDTAPEVVIAEPIAESNAAE